MRAVSLTKSSKIPTFLNLRKNKNKTSQSFNNHKFWSKIKTLIRPISVSILHMFGQKKENLRRDTNII